MQRPFTPRLSKLLATAGVLALIGSAPHAFAYTITTGGVTAGDGSGLTTAVATATVLDFNSLVAPTSGTFTTNGVLVSGSGAVVNGSVAGSYAAPTGDTTNYLAAGGSPSYTGSTTLAISGPANNYLGLYWGSSDSYNSLGFLNGGTTVATVTAANVGVAAGSSNYVNIYNLPSYDSVVLSTTTANFEVDNIAYGVVNTVPEPGTLALLGAGLLGLGIIRRRKTT